MFIKIKLVCMARCNLNARVNSPRDINIYYILGELVLYFTYCLNKIINYFFMSIIY